MCNQVGIYRVGRPEASGPNIATGIRLLERARKVHCVMQQPHDMNVAVGGNTIDNEMAGGATLSREVKGANSDPDFVSRTTCGVLWIFEQIVERAFEQRAILPTLRQSPTPEAVLQGVGDVPTRGCGNDKPSHLQGRVRFQLVHVDRDLRTRAQCVAAAFVDIPIAGIDRLP